MDLPDCGGTAKYAAEYSSMCSLQSPAWEAVCKVNIMISGISKDVDMCLIIYFSDSEFMYMDI